MIHNHEVRSSILRPATRKRTAEKSAVFFVACRDEVRPYRAGDHESLLSMGYRQIREIPSGMAGNKSDSTRDSNHGVFLGNKHLRSKSGLEGGTEWRLKHPATRYKKTTLQIPLRCFFVCPDFSPSRGPFSVMGNADFFLTCAQRNLLLRFGWHSPCAYVMPLSF